MIIINTIVLGFVVIYLLYKYINRNVNYWKHKGVPYLKPQLFFGNFYDIFLLKKTIGHKLAEMYNEMVGPYFGIWVFSTPHLIVKSPELMKQILQKDFKYFQDRNVAANEKADEMTAYVLFMLKNPEWKVMRNKTASTFTSAKVRSMVPLMNSVGEDLKSYMSKLLMKNSTLEMREVCAKFSTDVITSCVFGIDGNSFKNENATWRSVGRDMFAFTLSNGIRGTTYFFLSKLVDIFKVKFIPSHVSSFLREAFWQAIDKRERENVNRNDLLDTLIKLKNEGNFDGIKFEGDKVVAQAVQYFFAGFETTSATIMYTLYELCLNKSLQMKLISETKSNLIEHEEVTYDIIHNMKYLHKVVQETLRKYPALPFLERKCMMDYTIPDTDIVLEKGTPVYIPMLGLHYDPKYYPNPDVFDPERFSEESINSRPAFAYIPFGSGPHSCAGDRFGLTATKVALVHILSQFELERCSETPLPIEFEPRSFTLAPKHGLPIRLIENKTNSFTA